MDWTTALPDWESRIVSRRSLVPCKPLFPKEATAALDVFKALRVVDVAGSPTFGEAGDDWIFDIVAVIFGAYDASTGKRLIREFFLCVSKKNGKSTFAAAVMLTALIRNWRHSNELIIVAPTIEAAQNAFRPAADMVRADDDLDAASGRGFLHIQDHVRTITHLKTKATLKVVAADNATVVGKKAAFVLIDELWEFGKRANADSMMREATGGQISRDEGFVFSISTMADAPPSGVFKDKLYYARQVRDGEVVDRKFLPIIYEFPKSLLDEEAHLKSDYFYVTNPNVNRSVSLEWLEDQLRVELSKGQDTRNTFLAKHLNIEINQGLRSDGWAGARLWPRGVEKGLTLKEIIHRSEVLTAGTDGGGMDDLLGVAVIGREKGTQRWLGWAHAFISPEGWERRKANNAVYGDFIRDGDLTLVDQLPDDVSAVVDIIKQCMDSGKLAQVGVDPAGIGSIIDAFAGIGVTQENKILGGVYQGVALMGAFKAIERKLADGSFKHGGRPMMAWCARNAIVKQTGTGQRIARDESGYGKIDPLMAMFDAAAIMAMNPEPSVKEYQVMFA